MAKQQFVRTEHIRFSKKVRWVILVALVVAGLLVLYMYYLSQNRAADMVRPLGNELVNTGATEECSSGDSGHGPDNNAAYYRAYYDLRMSKNEAISLINRVARDNGYTLTHASPGNRGPLGAVADIYIDRWYFDDTSKQNPYIDIQPGPVKLAIVVNPPGSKNGCTPEKTVAAEHVEIGIEIRLREFKHW